MSEVKVVLVKPVEGPAPVALRKKLRLMIWLFGALSTMATSPAQVWLMLTVTLVLVI